MMRDWDLYLVTDNRVYPGRSHVDEVEAAIDGGIRVIQFREKQMCDREMIATGKVLRSLTSRAGVDLIINNRIDIALAVDADGVHIGQDDMPVALARRLLGPDKILGASVSSVAEAKIAQREGASYVAVSPVFSTSTKTDAPAPVGLEGLKTISKAVRVPVVAIGGINLENLEVVIGAGADSVAVVSAVVCAKNMTDATRELRSRIESAKSRVS